MSCAVTRAWSKVPVWMQNPGASTASWHVGLVALDALPSFRMSEWVVCLVCRAGESMANGETSHSERQSGCDLSPAPAEPTSVQYCASYSTIAKAVSRPHGFHCYTLKHSLWPRNQWWTPKPEMRGELSLCAMNPYDSQINIKNPRSGVYLWVISACERVTIVVLV